MDSSSSLKGSQLGKLMLSSGILDLAWSKISVKHALTYQNQNSGLGFEIFDEANCRVVVFAAPPISRNTSSNSASTLLSGSQDQNPFYFLCSQHISSFSLHTPAFQLFSSASKDLSNLKAELLRSKRPLIITGAALGGSVASLFTLWLLEAIDPWKKNPLCITFGSPLIGDASLQQILEDSMRGSCFLHVADAAQSPITAGFFKPFGTFLICFDSQCICMDDSETVVELLFNVNADLVDWRDYGEILHRLDNSVLSMGDSRPMSMSDDVIDRMEERAKKKKKPLFELFKRLDDMKILMTYIEGYKRISEQAKISFYDWFKTQTASPSSPVSMAVAKCKKELNYFWKTVVEEVETRPQSKISFFNRVVLFSGNNYRRMIEPLDIAEYYLSGGEEYRSLGRSYHYVMLEKWFNDASLKPARSAATSDLSDLLTLDSCFWAEVEEAMIIINQLKTQEGMRDIELLTGELVRFEEYVYRMIAKREVSPEIFLEKSSFMKWWKEYKGIKGRDGFNSSPSHFIEFMNTGMYQSYCLPSPNLGDHISGSATGLPPGPSDRLKSSVDKQEGQKVVHLKLHLLNDKEKTKALSTIAKISGVSSVAADGYGSISVTGNGTMDPVVLVKELSKYWPAEIINAAPSNKIKGKKEISKGQSDKQVEKSVKTQKIKDEESVLSSYSGSGSNIATNTDILVFSCIDNDVDETLFSEAILNGLHEREVTHVKYNLSGSDSLDTEMLYRSSVGIMVLSNSFARSSQSLDHLVVIMEHWKEKSFVIIPVYIKVTPPDIRRLEGWVEASVQLQHSVPKWEAAMNELASIDGHQWTEGTQFTLAEEVVRDAWLYLRNCKNVVRILALLKHGQPSDAEVVGIWGMAGIGKTFTAREIFGILAPQYDLCYFNLMCQSEGLRQMRDDFFSILFRGEKLSIDASDVKPSFMRDLFLNKKILIVLDDVSNARDAEYVVGGFGWFSHGHRIILTSRRKQVLLQCKVKEPYEMKICEFESLRLCKQFLNGGKSGIISELMSCSSGIPLALEVLGSSVSEKQHINSMMEDLQSLRIIPPIQIQEAFQRSFGGLNKNEKNIFLDLACFFGGEDKDHVVQLLDACGFFTSLGICDLIDESLISLLENKIEIPIPFQDMGRFIVREEDEDPSKRSRLWDSKDIIGVLTNSLGTEAIEGIFLDTSDLTCELSPTVFCEMDRLRLLKFYCSSSGNECKLNLHDGLDMLPDELRLLHWEHYPLKYLPQEFDPENLVEINMPYSNLEKLWEGKKNLEKLKKLKLSNSKNLTDIRMLSEALNLENIDLEGCTSLVDISTSIPRCGKLVSLNMKDCSRLRSLPSMADLTYLKLLNLSGCSELEENQDFAPNLKELYLAGTAIAKLPLSIANLWKFRK